MAEMTSSPPIPDVTEEGPVTMCDRDFQNALEVLAEREKEVLKLRDQLDEVLCINHNWDEEYKELKQSFDAYRVDSQLAQRESNNVISRLKQEKHVLKEQLRDIKVEKERVDRKLNDLRAKYDFQKRQYMETLSQLRTTNEQLKKKNQTPPTSPGGSSSSAAYKRRIAELEEERTIITTQLHTYKEDFEAEKRDRERLTSERETERLRFEAEIASLKIQLDRVTGDLVRFKAEATRLAHQLRLKQQQEDEEYRKHLESQGYSPRKPLPPLDPFVEKDLQPSVSYYHHSNHSSQTPPPSPHITVVACRPSLGYQTHMTEIPAPVYTTDIQHYKQVPYANNIYSPTSHTYGVTPPATNQDFDQHSGVVLRSVSPQIHRIGNLRLFSRDVISQEEKGGPTNEQKVFSTNNLDTDNEATQSRQVQSDPNIPAHFNDTLSSSPVNYISDDVITTESDDACHTKTNTVS